MSTETHHKVTDRYTVSVVLWGGKKANEDPSGHVAVAVHRSDPQPATCHLHHARWPDQLRFIYESRPEQHFDADPAPRGRCNIRTTLSSEDTHIANAVLPRFSADKAQLPYFGDDNFHDWTADAVAALEHAGLAAPGDGELWADRLERGRWLWNKASLRTQAGSGWFARSSPQQTEQLVSQIA